MKADAKFWAKVDKSGECWLWTGCKTRGYGHLSRRCNGKTVWLRAHRVAWETAHGDVPSGMVVRHHCDNPSCVRPEHLFLRSQAENLRDMRAKGRGRLTEQQAREVLAASKAGLPIAPLHRKFGVARSTVYAVAYGVNWRHLRAG